MITFDNLKQKLWKLGGQLVITFDQETQFEAEASHRDTLSQHLSDKSVKLGLLVKCDP